MPEAALRGLLAAMGGAVKSKLKREHPQPLYRQVLADLQQRIASGQLKPGAQLPSLRELTEAYGVSSITVRRALEMLQHQGSLYSVPGKGFYVSGFKVLKPATRMASFSDDMVRNGLHPSSRVLEATIVPAEPRVSDMLMIAPGAEVVRLHRVRLGDGIPMCIELTHLPHALCPGILRHDFAKASLYEVLRNDYGLASVRGAARVCAGLAGERELRLLDLFPPVCVLRLEAQELLASGQVIDYTQAAHRSDCYEIEFAVGSPVFAQGKNGGTP